MTSRKSLSVQLTIYNLCVTLWPLWLIISAGERWKWRDRYQGSAGRRLCTAAGWAGWIYLIFYHRDTQRYTESLLLFNPCVCSDTRRCHYIQVIEESKNTLLFIQGNNADKYFIYQPLDLSIIRSAVLGDPKVGDSDVRNSRNSLAALPGNNNYPTFLDGYQFYCHIGRIM